MKKTQSRKRQTVADKISAEKTYSLSEAATLLTEVSTVKFDATAEIHINLDINPKHADQQLRTTVSLPHGTGKSVRVLVFCEDELVAKAKAAGAIEAGSDNLIGKVLKGWTDFDVVIATPSMMKSIAKAARILGPKGLMPNPKAGTVTMEIEKTTKALLAGRIEMRNDKFGIVHSYFGKMSFGPKKLEENLKMFLDTLKASKPVGVKGTFIKKITVNPTMGPGIKIES